MLLRKLAGKVLPKFAFVEDGKTLTTYRANLATAPALDLEVAQASSCLYISLLFHRKRSEVCNSKLEKKADGTTVFRGERLFKTWSSISRAPSFNKCRNIAEQHYLSNLFFAGCYSGTTTASVENPSTRAISVWTSNVTFDVIPRLCQHDIQFIAALRDMSPFLEFYKSQSSAISHS